MSVLSLLLGGADTDLGFGLLPPAAPQARSGEAVALSDDATTVPLTVAVSAPGYLNGAVHIYQFDGTTYNFYTTILSPAPNIDFGDSVALNSDGTVLAIGAPDDQGEGRIHMYEWDVPSQTYVVDEVLDPNVGGLGPLAGGRTGESVALSKAGDSLLASAPQANTDNRGWAYSWFKSGTWIFVAQRIGETGVFQANGNCSESMGMSADGLTIILLQPGGAQVRIFERASISAAFSEVFTLQISTIGGLLGVAIEDGGLLVFVTDPPAGVSTGGVRSFVKNGTWGVGAFVAAPVLAGPTFGGVIVARNNDFFVGEDSGDFIHEFTYTNLGAMTFVASTDAPDNGTGNQYGHSLSLVFPIGTRNLAIGEPLRDRLGFIDAGNAYVQVV